MNDVSAFGTVVTLQASATFPAGIVLTQFSDDTDAFDTPSTQIGDAAAGVNGDLVTWSKAIPLSLTMSFIAESDDDINMGILYESNRVAKGKGSIQDVITITAVYPSGKTVTFNNGKITDGPPADSLASTGRLKTKVYGFKFENRTVTN